jgi:hypothetical protein
MRSSNRRTAFVAAGIVLAFSLDVPVAVAQDRPIEPNDFGTENVGVTVLPWTDFRPPGSPADYDTLAGHGVSPPSTLGQVFVASLNRGLIPNGALIREIRFYVEDSEASGDVQCLLIWEAVDADTGQDPKYDYVLVGTTSGTPGPTTVGSFPNRQFLQRQDIDGDGTLEMVSYYLFVNLPSSDSALQMARILWKRRVSAPPATATFGDVPTSSPIFQFVEALADANITGGCGGGNFCPDESLTRGQMAVFLSVALGLNWDVTQTQPNP